MKNALLTALLAMSMGLFPALAIPGETDPEVDKLFSKLTELGKKGPYSLDIKGKADVAQMGMSMKMDMTGDMVYSDEKHMRMNMKMKMKMPKVEGQQAQGMPTDMEVAMLQVSDGTTVWTEINMMSMGMKQVMKGDIEELRKQDGGSMGMGQASQLEPSQMLENFKKMLNMKVKEKKDGKVTIEAVFTEEAAQKMNLQSAGMEKGKFHMVLDEKNFFPMTFKILLGETPMMDFSFTNLKHVKKESLKDSFTYTPPEGVQVIDMVQMMKMQQGQ